MSDYLWFPRLYRDKIAMMALLLIVLVIVIAILYLVFVISRQPYSIFGPSSSSSEQYQNNYDKNVIHPLKLLKGHLTVIDYRDNYDRLISEFSIGFVHGFMAYTTFQDTKELENHNRVMEKISPFTKPVIARVFSDKERADLVGLLDGDLTKSELWREGYENGWRDCEAWQQAGEIKNNWLNFIRHEN